MRTLDTPVSSNLSPVMGQTGASGESRPRQAKLWSNMPEVCCLLGIQEPVGGDELQFQHMRFKPGQRVHTIGQPFDMLFVVSSGFLKSVMIDECGREQVLAFPMKGDLFGIDGIHSKHYNTETMALTTCEIVLIPFRVLFNLGRSHPEVEAAFFSVMSRELIREQSMISAIGALSAEARVARFLTSMSDRFSAMGYSGTQFNLRMTRQDIGSYLGVTLETVSRTLSSFHAARLIDVDQRTIKIHDIKSLRVLRRLSPTREKPSSDNVSRTISEASKFP